MCIVPGLAVKTSHSSSLLFPPPTRDWRGFPEPQIGGAAAAETAPAEVLPGTCPTRHTSIE